MEKKPNFVFNLNEMKKYIKSRYYKKFLAFKLNSKKLDDETKKQVVLAIKKWAEKQNVTDYVQLFFPLNSNMSGKLIKFDSKNFDEDEFIKGETDASSFIHFKNTSTHQARGYVIFDFSSYPFILENEDSRTLYVPCMFCSYDGLSLDEKIPLKKAEKFLNEESLKTLKFFNVKAESVFLNVGAEQEYFLIDKENFDKRPDLKNTNRALISQVNITNQHYFSLPNNKTEKFMEELEKTLSKINIKTKIQHSEVAPNQFEFVPEYTTANFACEQNEITMKIIENLAEKFNLKAIFHEKPFSDINGSGKHMNISLSTNTNLNLIDSENTDEKIYSTFMITLISAIDKFNKLLLLSAYNYTNDLRLGSNEAPPKTISIFLGDGILKRLKGEKSKILHENLIENLYSICEIKKDVTNRNRTSPFAYNKNKFEFRLVGSSMNLSFPCTVLSTIWANELKIFNENCKNENFNYQNYLMSELKKHEKIIFNGDGYSNFWKIESKNRGINIDEDIFEMFSIFDEDKVIKLFEENSILKKSELEIRKNVLMKNYFESVITESKVLSFMMKDFITNLNEYIFNLTENFEKTKNENLSEEIKKLTKINEKLIKNVNFLIKNIKFIDNLKDDRKTNDFINQIILTMNQIKKIYNELENMLPKRLLFLSNDELLDM